MNMQVAGVLFVDGTKYNNLQWQIVTVQGTDIIGLGTDLSLWNCGRSFCRFGRLYE